MLENSDHDSVETLFSDHNSSFVSLLVSQKFAEALSSGRAHPFPGGEREDAVRVLVLLYSATRR